MSHTPNALIDMFPNHVDAIHELKIENNEFSRIFAEYHDLTREIHRGETNVVAMDDFHMEDLRKRRLQILDRVTKILK